MDLKIDEDWIKKRVNLEDENPGDVKAIALPGSYHEKIASLGTSLSNFARLKQLDLSKNALVTLEGLEHLKYLEELNLYYNQIPDLKEVFRLRKNQALREIDLRLNPVTKTEPDYRLFVVHMLPMLRKLDDRSVRDSERKAALMHFTSDQATEMSAEHDQHELPTEPSVSGQPRVEYVRRMTRRPNDDDACRDVIDDMQPRQHKQTNEPHIEKLSHQEKVKMCDDPSPVKYRQPRASQSATSHSSKKSAPMRGEPSSGEEYDKFMSVANFTPHPGADAQTPPTVFHNGDRNNNDGANLTDESPSEVRRLSFEDSLSERVASRQTQVQLQSDLVDDLLDLVDKYWNGSKSLHYHKKFRGLIQKPLDQFTASLTSGNDVKVKYYQEKVATLEQENHDLHARMHTMSKRQQGVDHKNNEVAKLHNENENLRSRLHALQSENVTMHEAVSCLKNETKNVASRQKSRDNEHLREIEHEKRSLAQQVANLKLQLKNYERLDGVTKMLQESHKSLISTNDRLVSDLEDTRTRHQGEIEQLKWSYDQLRKTTSILNGSTEITNGYS